MPMDPVEELRRLSALYSEMGDIEIEELANQINDLTPAAQDVLRNELKKRGMFEDRTTNSDLASFSHQGGKDRRIVSHFVPASEHTDESVEEVEDDTVVEFSWKTLLRECPDIPEARAISRVLMMAGIESWIERSAQSYFGAGGGPKVVVAADQLEHAQQILLQPIPPDILEDERELYSAPQFELPTCPNCGAPDPVLESVEPSNNWLCESCDHTWSDPVADETRLYEKDR